MNRIFKFFESDILTSVSSEKCYSGDYRLDPGHFLIDTNINLNKNIRFEKLADVSIEIIEPKLFTRFYCKPQYGVPYISSSEMSELEPPINSRFISKELTENLDQYIIRRGQILVSAAGTVGSIVVAPKLLEGVAGTSDILRIIPKENELGFIYTYLISSYGANELNNLAYGAIIKRVRGFQLEELKIPIIDIEVKKQINLIINRVLKNRDVANDLLEETRTLVLTYNNLPPLDEVQPETMDPDKEIDLRLVGIEEFTSDYRLDAHFYNPMAELAVRNIIENAKDIENLSNLTSKIFYLNRFKRTFVSGKYGIPYLAGKDIIKIRPSDISYLSISETDNLEDYKLEKEWILLTCSGTIGRTCYIWKNYENWVGTHDLIRVVTNKKFDSGYLYAFLSSDYGYHQIIRYKHGAVIDHLTPEQIEEILIPIPNKDKMKEIGDLVRQAYDLRAEAIRLEDEAQEILTESLTGK
ncbi:MAG: restriction endonuclease subunit S, partial [Promethearchaeota archaeon]